MARRLTAAWMVLWLCAAVAAAHHGSADYHVDREVTVTGRVEEWRWTNPHTWIVIAVTTEDGSMETWDGEGPPLTWAAQRGWSRDTLRAGEEVTLIMYPSRRSERSGLVRRIERRTGEVIPVSRPWLERD
jgi:hypothetical protein